MKYFIPIAALLMTIGCHEQPAPATQPVAEITDSVHEAATPTVFVTHASTELIPLYGTPEEILHNLVGYGAG